MFRRTNLRTKGAMHGQIGFRPCSLKKTICGQICGQKRLFVDNTADICGHLRTSADECADRHHDLRSEVRPVDRSGSLWTSLWTHRQSADKTADEFADRLAICREKCGQICGRRCGQHLVHSKSCGQSCRKHVASCRQNTFCRPIAQGCTRYFLLLCAGSKI